MTAERDDKKAARKAAAKAGEPVAPTPTNQDAESTAAEAPAAGSAEPVAPTPETQMSAEQQSTARTAESAKAARKPAQPATTAGDASAPAQAAEPTAPTSEPKPSAEQGTAHTARPQTAGSETAARKPAQPAATAGAAPARHGVSAGGAFVLGLIAALLLLVVLAAAAFFTFPTWRPQLAGALVPAEDGRLAAVETRASRLDEQLNALSGRIDGLDNAVDGLRQDLAQRPTTVVAPNGDALSQRLAALEAAGRPDAERIERLVREQEQLSQQLAQARESLAALQKGSADAATVLRLTDRVEAAETAVRQAQSRANTAQSLLLAVGQLREAINRGDAYDAELRALRAIAEGDAETSASLEALAALGGKPIATRVALADSFDQLSGAIVRAELGPDEDGWWRQTVQRLASVITIRRTEGDVAGDSTAAVVARTDANLDKGDLAGAVRELSGLQGAAAEAAAPWLAQAQARLAAEAALSDLTAHSVAVSQASNG